MKTHGCTWASCIPLHVHFPATRQMLASCCPCHTFQQRWKILRWKMLPREGFAKLMLSHMEFTSDSNQPTAMSQTQQSAIHSNRQAPQHPMCLLQTLNLGWRTWSPP